MKNIHDDSTIMAHTVERNNPKVSIVTPSYNQGKYIGQCIDSVRNQSYRPIEHIIHDNCSTDETKDALEEYAANPNGVETRIVCAPDDGQTDALNRGFRMATGDIVGWLNADDYYLPDTIGKIVDELMADEGVDVLYGDFFFVDEGGRIVKRRKEIGFDFWIMLYVGCYIPSTATFFRKRIFEEGFYLDAGFDYIMDGEFFLRLHKAGKVFRHTPDYLACFRRHGGNKSLNAQGRARDRRMLRDRYGVRFSRSDRVNEMFRRPARAFFLSKRVFVKLVRGCYF